MLKEIRRHVVIPLVLSIAYIALMFATTIIVGYVALYVGEYPMDSTLALRLGERITLRAMAAITILYVIYCAIESQWRKRNAVRDQSG